MFKRGGSSFQAQGTGITSPYDTPRKKYNLGSWGEWEQKTRDVTKDPRGDWSYAAQGFSSLGNPYKESGGAKTIGEMLWEGAQGVRGSKEKARELEQKGELAILESQGGRMLAEEDRKFTKAEAALERDLKLKMAAMKSDEYLQNLPRDRQIENYEKIWTDDVNNQLGGPSEWQKEFKTRIPTAIVDARMHNSKTRKDTDRVYTEIAPETAYTLTDAGWALDTSKLTTDRVWFDVTTSTWFFIDEEGNRFDDISIAVATDKFKSFKTGAPIESQGDSVGDNAGTIKRTEKGDVDEDGKLKKKVVEKEPSYLERDYKAEHYMPQASTDVIEESIKTADETGKSITDFWNWVASPKRGPKKLVQKAKGGRIGYAEGDVAITELDMLNNWWKNMQANDWKE